MDEEEKYYKRLEEIREKLDANPHLTPHTRYIFCWMLWEVYDPTSLGPPPCAIECPHGMKATEACKETCYLEVFNLLRDMIEHPLKEQIKELEKALVDSEESRKKKIQGEEGDQQEYSMQPGDQR